MSDRHSLKQVTEYLNSKIVDYLHERRRPSRHYVQSFRYHLGLTPKLRRNILKDVRGLVEKDIRRQKRKKKNFTFFACSISSLIVIKQKLTFMKCALDCIDEITNTPLSIAIVVQQSSGKSMLVSRLINREIDLPSGDEATTGQITKLFYSETPVIRKIRTGHWDEYGLYIQYDEPLVVEEYPEEMTEDILMKFICSGIGEEEVEVPSQEKSPSEYMTAYRNYKESMLEISSVVDIGIPAESLKQGLTIIDCPGFNGPQTTKMTMKKLMEQNPSIICYVYDYRKRFGMKDGELLSNLIRESGSSVNYILVANIFEEEVKTLDSRATKFYVEEENYSVANLISSDQIWYPILPMNIFRMTVSEKDRQSLHELKNKILQNTSYLKPVLEKTLNCCSAEITDILKSLIIKVQKDSENKNASLHFSTELVNRFLNEEITDCMINRKKRFDQFCCCILSISRKLLSTMLMVSRQNLWAEEYNFDVQLRLSPFDEICFTLKISNSAINDILMQTIEEWNKEEIKYWTLISSVEKNEINGFDYFQIRYKPVSLQTLHDASRFGNVFVIKLNLVLGEKVNMVDGENKTPLYIACENGHENVFNILLNEGADINASDNGRNTPLHIACENGHENIVNILVDQGANINSQNYRKNTPLHFACKNGHETIAMILLDRGADINAQNGESSTPLHYACKSGHLNLAQILLDRGHGIQPLDYLQNTPLHYASRLGHEKVVKILLNRGADINALNREKMTALHYACSFGHENVVKILLDRGADISALNQEKKMTALHYACSVGHEKVVNILLNRGADINALNREGSTALHVSSRHGHEKVVKWLLDRGADINKRNQEGLTSIDFASQNSQWNIVNLLQNKLANMGLQIDKNKDVCFYNREDTASVTSDSDHGFESATEEEFDDKTQDDREMQNITFPVPIQGLQQETAQITVYFPRSIDFDLVKSENYGTIICNENDLDKLLLPERYEAAEVVEYIQNSEFKVKNIFPMNAEIFGLCFLNQQKLNRKTILDVFQFLIFKKWGSLRRSIWILSESNFLMDERGATSFIEQLSLLTLFIHYGLPAQHIKIILCLPTAKQELFRTVCQQFQQNQQFSGTSTSELPIQIVFDGIKDRKIMISERKPRLFEEADNAGLFIDVQKISSIDSDEQQVDSSKPFQNLLKKLKPSKIILIIVSSSEFFQNFNCRLLGVLSFVQQRFTKRKYILMISPGVNTLGDPEFSDTNLPDVQLLRASPEQASQVFENLLENLLPLSNDLRWSPLPLAESGGTLVLPAPMAIILCDPDNDTGFATAHRLKTILNNRGITVHIRERSLQTFGRVNEDSIIYMKNWFTKLSQSQLIIAIIGPSFLSTQDCVLEFMVALCHHAISTLPKLFSFIVSEGITANMPNINNVFKQEAMFIMTDQNSNQPVYLSRDAISHIGNTAIQFDGLRVYIDEERFPTNRTQNADSLNIVEPSLNPGSSPTHLLICHAHSDASNDIKDYLERNIDNLTIIEAQRRNHSDSIVESLRARHGGLVILILICELFLQNSRIFNSIYELYQNLNLCPIIRVVYIDEIEDLRRLPVFIKRMRAIKLNPDESLQVFSGRILDFIKDPTENPPSGVLMDAPGNFERTNIEEIRIGIVPFQIPTPNR